MAQFLHLLMQMEIIHNTNPINCNKMKKLMTLAALMLWTAVMWADSPLTSTDFSRAYAPHPMVEMAAELEAGDFLPTKLLDFLADKDSPVDERMAVINSIGWAFEGHDGYSQLGDYLMKRYKVKTIDKLVKKLDAKTLCVYAYAKAMSNYFEVSEAARLAHEAVKKNKDNSFTVAFIAALIDAQIYLDSDWCAVYNVVADVAHDGSLKLDMEQGAIDIVMEYINLYKEYCK